MLGLPMGYWSTSAYVSGEDARFRRQYLSRTYLRSARAREPLQSVEDLQGIPSGTPVVVHLFRGAGRANPALKSRLAELLGRRPARPGGPPRVGHVGTTFGPFTWSSSMASPALQQATRYVFFDPGDAVLDLIYGRQRVNVERYRTTQNEPTVLIEPNGPHPIHIEAQPESFGIVWPTALDPVSAVRAAMGMLPSPSGDDEAVIVLRGDDDRRRHVERVSTDRLLETLDAINGSFSAIRLVLGTASIAWARALDEGTSAITGEMSFGDDHYVKTQVRSLLAETAILPDGVELESVLDVADGVLQGRRK